ncbi:MAG: hypothetical protein WC911_09890, partial [Thermoleophilia bacterium]
MENRDKLDLITLILVDRETLEKEEFDQLAEGVPEEEVFREKDALAAAAKEEGPISARGVKEPSKKTEKSDGALPKEPPLEAPSYTKTIDTDEAPGGFSS